MEDKLIDYYENLYENKGGRVLIKNKIRSEEELNAKYGKWGCKKPQFRTERKLAKKNKKGR